MKGGRVDLPRELVYLSGDRYVFPAQLHGPIRKRCVRLGADEADGFGGVAGDEGCHVLHPNISPACTRIIYLAPEELTNSIIAPIRAPDSFLNLAIAWLPSNPPSSAAYQ
jgi:hypothetical protein